MKVMIRKIFFSLLAVTAGASIFIVCNSKAQALQHDLKDGVGADVNLKSLSDLSVTWSVFSQNRELKDLSLADLRHFKQVQSYEKDPVTQKLVPFKGVLLSQVIDDAIAPLSAEDRAHFDLIILKGKGGQTASIPRALVTKYPLLLVSLSEVRGKEEGYRGPLYSVVPWSSKSKIMNEELPLESFFVPHVVHIDLTNYSALYGDLYLKRRTDPLAIRGEKVFVQSCAGCHSLRPGSHRLEIADEDRMRQFVLNGHLEVKGMMKVSDSIKRSLSRYLDAFRMENMVAGGSAGMKSAQMGSP